YKVKCACFHCRKCFKQRSWLDLPQRLRNADGARIFSCPQCRQPMTNMGWDFKVPRQTDVEQWKKVELLAKNGWSFHSYCCGDSNLGPGPRPARLKEVPQFLEEQKRADFERRRKLRIEERAHQLKVRRRKRQMNVVAR
ncbi:MAG: hypothetical protein EOP09_11605, partial [Proteobacteria bacterium]